jgi:hypothetical protein
VLAAQVALAEEVWCDEAVEAGLAQEAWGGVDPRGGAGCRGEVVLAGCNVARVVACAYRFRLGPMGRGMA